MSSCAKHRIGLSVWSLWSLAVVTLLAATFALAYALIPDSAANAPSQPVQTTATISPETDGLSEREELRKLFQKKGFDLSAVREGEEGVPRVFVPSLPGDLKEEKDISQRKSLFIRSVLPLILRVNEEIKAKRARVLAIKEEVDKGVEISMDDRRWLSDVSEKYGYSFNDVGKLLERLDVVPVSLALAQAIQESGWGTSRFVREGNALFGQRTWSDENEGLVPKEVGENEAFRVRSFKRLEDSIRSYVHNLNTHPSYRYFRERRANLRREGIGINGYVLAGTLLSYSEEGEDYVAALRSLIRSNRLQDFDTAQLMATPATSGAS